MSRSAGESGTRQLTRPGLFLRRDAGRNSPWPPRKNGGVPPKSADCRYTLTATRARSLHVPDADLKTSSGARLTPTAYSRRASSSARSGFSRASTTRGWPSARRRRDAPAKSAGVADEIGPGSFHPSMRRERSLLHAHGVSAASPDTAEERSPPPKGAFHPAIGPGVRTGHRRWGEPAPLLRLRNTCSDTFSPVHTGLHDRCTPLADSSPEPDRRANARARPAPAGEHANSGPLVRRSSNG